jgi:hypothetical protein
LKIIPNKTKIIAKATTAATMSSKTSELMLPLLLNIRQTPNKNVFANRKLEI